MNGRTALHYAAHQGYEKVCNALLRRGASIGIEDHNRSTPIDLALRCGRRSASFMKSVSTELMQQIRRRPSLFASLSASGPPSNHVSPLSVRKAVTGHWEGDYEYLHLKEPRKGWWTIDFPGIADTTETRDDTIFKEPSEEELAFSSSGADLWGAFAVYGFVDPASCVWFVKLCESTGWLNKGKLSADMEQLRETCGGSRKL